MVAGKGCQVSLFQHDSVVFGGMEHDGIFLGAIVHLSAIFLGAILLHCRKDL